jgi:uncharacterized protein (TIGR02145 family)
VCSSDLIEIGGEAGFDGIDWANGIYFIKTETDPNGGTSYTITGVSQLLSVPYALHAKTAESITGTVTETDPSVIANFDFTDAANGDLLQFNGTKWVKVTPDYISDYTVIETDVTAHEAAITVTESQISDLGTYIETETQTISDVAALDNSVNTQLKNVTNPTDEQDAATKAYVDQLLSLFEDNGMVVVDFSVADTDISLGNSVAFTDNSVLATTTWQWDFGDGNTSTEQNPTHTYTAEGTYTVSLTASNGVLSSTKTKLDYIVVTDGPSSGSFTDARDGNVYQTVVIGTQEWMAENLKYLPSVVGPATGSEISGFETESYYYVYDYDGTDVAEAKATANYITYGVLYNWTAAMDGEASSTTNPSGIQGVCPAGWHLPSDAEWTELTDYLGGTSVAGGKLKETGTTHWNSPNTSATNETGFTALPGGYRSGSGAFYLIGDYGLWWSATENSTGYAWYRGMSYDLSYVGRVNDDKELGFSVRCLRD